MHGLREGFVKLENSDNRSRKTTDIRRKRLRRLFGEEAVEVVHIGSTALKNIKARPVTDLMVALKNKQPARETLKGLLSAGYGETELPFPGDYRCFVLKELNMIICRVFVVGYKSAEYWSLINFRDYLNVNTLRKKEYEELKLSLAATYPDNTEAYTEGKRAFTEKITEEAKVWRIFSRSVVVNITRQMGSKTEDGRVLRLNSGEAEMSDSDAMKPSSVYIIGENKPVKRFTGRITAILTHRDNDGTVKEAWVASPPGKPFFKPDIQSAVENDDGISYRYICLYEKSCGAVVYFMKDGDPLYLLIKNRSQNMGFPKGHVEMDEDEYQTAKREIMEETNLHVSFDEGFREFYAYTINFCRKKQAVYFLARAGEGKIVIPKNEILSYSIVSFKDALKALSHSNEKKVLRDAQSYLERLNTK